MSIEDKSTLQSLINSLFPDNNTREISAADLRQYLLSELDSEQIQRQLTTTQAAASFSLTQAQLDQNLYFIFNGTASQVVTLPAITSEMINRAYVGMTRYTEALNCTFEATGADTILGLNPLTGENVSFIIKPIDSSTWIIQSIDLSQPASLSWRDEWVNGLEYNNNEIVRDGEWLMIANKTTLDKPAPQPTEPPTYVLPTTPAWATNNNTSVIHSGHVYTFTSSGWIRQIRIWAPNLTSNTNYRTIITDITNPAIPEQITIEEPVLIEDAWTVIANLNKIIVSGTILEVRLDVLDSGATTVTNHPWTRTINSQSVDPGARFWNRDNQNAILRMNTLDNDSVDQSTDLDTVTLDTLFRMEEDGNPANFIEYRVTSIVAGSPNYEWLVDVNLASAEGGPEIGDLTNVVQTVPVPSATQFVQLAAQWPANNPVWATLVGFLEFNGVLQSGTDDDAFGVDVQFVEGIISDDWDLMSRSSDT